MPSLATVTPQDVRPLPGAVTIRGYLSENATAGQVLAWINDPRPTPYFVPAAEDHEERFRAAGVLIAGPDGRTSFSAGDMVDIVVAGPVAGIDIDPAGPDEMDGWLGPSPGLIVLGKPGTGFGHAVVHICHRMATNIVFVRIWYEDYEF